MHAVNKEPSSFFTPIVTTAACILSIIAIGNAFSPSSETLPPIPAETNEGFYANQKEPPLPLNANIEIE